MSKKSWPMRGDVYWVDLNPTKGTEINKKRPAVVISNDSANEISQRVIVAPITSSVTKVFPFEVKISIKAVNGKVLLDQLRSCDKQRLNNKITSLDMTTMEQIDVALKIALGLS